LKNILPNINSGLLFIFLCGLFFLLSCSPTKHLKDNEYLINKSKIKIEGKSVNKSTLKKYDRLRPNRRVLGIRFHLLIYNMANPEKDKFFHNWFRRIGEAPIIYDSLKVSQSINNFSKYLSDIGYYDVRISKTETKKTNKKVDVFYKVMPGEPLTINSLNYYFEDTSIQSFIYADTSSALIKKGMNFNKPLMNSERHRIELLLKNNGYYSFSKEYIYYEVNSGDKPKTVDITLNIKQNIKGFINPKTKIRPHRQYKINKVYIVPDAKRTENNINIDTVVYKDHSILYFGKRKLNPPPIVAANRILPGELYSLKKVEYTYANLSSLGLFRFININLHETKPSENFDNVNCRIELAMRKRQSYTFEIVGTNSGSDLGVSSNLTYNNYNLFRGGEHFKIGVSGSYESLKNRLDLDPIFEYGIVSRFETPMFLLPFSAPDFKSKFHPRTVIQFSYNNQNQPEYQRTIANVSFGYTWRGNVFNKHSIYPVDFYLVKLPRAIDSAYIQKFLLNNERLQNSFSNHTILGLRYNFEYSNQSKSQIRNYIYIRNTIENAGLLTNNLEKATDWGKDSLLFGVNYAQYVKFDVDFRQFFKIETGKMFAYRFFAGIGIPYGNSISMPFERMYWSGGPYGIRAWGDHMLGPGSFSDTSLNNIGDKNRLGDLKLEMNLEYRFKLIWKLEGALFSDIGNIWLLKEDPSQPRGNFEFKDFYKDLAIGTGFGLRFDFSFVIFRFDLGFKLRNPAITKGSLWTIKNSTENFWNPTFQFGIGYPF